MCIYTSMNEMYRIKILTKFINKTLTDAAIMGSFLLHALPTTLSHLHFQ